VTRADVARDFGEAFAAKLFEAAQGVWEGPVASPFGLHFLFVRDRGEGGVPRLEEVREAVEREFLNERRNKTEEAFYQNLRKRYDVVIEGSPGAADRQMGALP
jgi:parvulin-like peptidyl-prolyl isomerase